MSNMLKVAEEIEEKLKSVGLVGSRLGSGFCFIDNSRDVQFEYKKDVIAKIEEITNDYYAKIEEVVKDVISKYDDLTTSFTYRLDNFSFYIAPKREECKCKCEEEVCEDELYSEDDEKKEDYHNSKDLQMWDNTSELLLKAVDYYLEHVTLKLEDMGTFNALQEKLMKLAKKDK